MRRSLSLGAKLNLALLVFLLLLGAATLAVMVYGFNRTQDNATDRSRAALKEEGKLALKALAGGVSDSGALQIEWAAEIGQRASRYLEEFKAANGTPAYDLSRFAQTDQDVWYDPDPNRRTDVVVPNHVELEGTVVDDIAYSAPLDALLPALAGGFPGELSGDAFHPFAIIFIGVNGVGRYYPPIGIQGTTPAELDISDFYDRFGPVANPDRETSWTPPYEDLNGRGLVITAQTPIYEGAAFRGIFEVDLSIASMVEQINELKPTESGFTFYVDKEGELLRTDSFDLLSREAEENSGLAAVLDAMKAPAEGQDVIVEEVTLVGEEYFIAHLPMAPLGGSIGVAAPVDEVTEQAAAITEGIEDEGNRTFAIMLIALGGLFIVGLAGASYLNRRVIVRPVQRLAEATRAVAAGDLDTKVELERRDEFGALATSFNAMVEQLRESERTLERKVDERTRELDALLRADAELYRSLDLDEVLQALCDVAVDVVGADKSLVSIWDEHRGQAFVRAARNFDPESISLLQDALTGAGHPGPAHDFEAQFYEAASIAALSPQMQAIQERAHIQATTDIPIRSPAGLVLGGFGVAYSEPHDFSEDERRLLIALAERAAVAIQNAELYARGQQAASLEERQRLARELHDSVSQALYGIALGARTARELIDREPSRAAEPVDYVLSLAEAGLAEMRALIFELRPESLEQEGLVEALRKQVAATQARFSITVDVTLCDEPDTSIDVKEAVYRVGQEALHNLVKHAKASRAALTLSHDNGTVSLEVRDDGAGFDPEGDFAGHLGLRSMQERTAKVGGSLAITSAPGQGTVVQMRIPLKEGTSSQRPMPT